MVTVTIEGKEFIFAETWSEIYFNQYIDMIKILKEKNENELEQSVKLIAYISDKPEECIDYLMRLSQDDYTALSKEFEWTNKEIDTVAEEKEFILIDDKKYRVKKDYHKLSLGEMVSVETLIGMNKNLDPFEVAFGVLLREVNEDGTEKPFNPDEFISIVNKLQKKVLLMDVYNYITFFLRGAQTSTKHTPGYSIQRMAKS
jgi:hypothetical protein